MGLVKKSEDAGKEAPDAPEDPPAVKTLKDIDNKYLDIEREYEKEVMKLQLEYAKKQKPLLEERKKLLTSGDLGAPASSPGTPALAGFWLTAMKNHPAFEDSIQEWDEPVLEFLTDVEKEYVDETNTEKGFKLVFNFADNPYFSNSRLEKEYATEEDNPYSGDVECKSVKSTEIEWKAGKNVTVAKVTKKPKGGGAKKAKQKKETEEARPSFFREFFRNVSEGTPLRQDYREALQEQGMAEVSDDEDDEMMIKYLLDNEMQSGTALRDHIVPFAVRWYTGEAVPEGYQGGPDDDDDDDDDDDLDEEDSEEDEDSDDAPPAKGRAAKGKAKSAGGGKKGGGDKSAEECKQQ